MSEIDAIPCVACGVAGPRSISHSGLRCARTGATEAATPTGCSGFGALRCSHCLGTFCFVCTTGVYVPPVDGPAAAAQLTLAQASGHDWEAAWSLILSGDGFNADAVTGDALQLPPTPHDVYTHAPEGYEASALPTCAGCGNACVLLASARTCGCGVPYCGAACLEMDWHTGRHPTSSAHQHWSGTAKRAAPG